MNVVAAILIAAAPMPVLTPAQCQMIGQYIFWIPDYRDVKADKEILKARMRGPEELLAFMREEIDRIYANKNDGESEANAFLQRCLARRHQT